MTLSWHVYVDWDYTGGWTYDYTQSYDDISDYVKSWRINTGVKEEDKLVAANGGATIALENSDKRFSPAYTSSPYYGKLTTRLPVAITVTDGVQTWTRFQGFIRSITPEGGLSGRIQKTEATLEADDLITILQTAGVTLPLFENVTGDVIVKAAINAALRAPAATANIQFTGNPSNNDTLIIDGVTITFKNTLSGAANEVRIGVNAAETAANLADMINKAFGVGTTYQGGIPVDRVTAAAAAPATVTLEAKVAGTYGNAIAISKSSSAITLSGPTLAGGVDYPPGKFAIDTGKTTWGIAGDRWVGQKTNALRIIQDVTDSERGRFYCKDDGTLVWENRDKLFTPITNTPIANLNSVYAQTQGSMDVEKVYNRVVVSYSPKNVLSEGVVARAGTPITIPPYGSGTPTMRYNPNDPFNDPKATVLRLPYIDPATGEKMGAKSLHLPLAAVTDIYVTDTEDGSGFNYTPVNRNSTLRLAVADTGDGVEIQCINTAIGNLYINTLQVRGVGIVSYNPTEFIFEDTDKQAVDQAREMKLSIPLPATLNYIRALAQYFLGRYKDARYRLQGLIFGDLEEGAIPGVSANIFSLNQGDLITVTDDQLGLSAVKYRIIGIQSTMRASKNMQISLYLATLDDRTFWLLGSSAYSKLGTTTRLAV